MFERFRDFAAVGSALRWVLGFVLGLFVCFVVLLVADRFANPISTVMFGRMLTGQKVERISVPLSAISPNLVAAVVSSEDAHFCRHHGVDWGALREVIDESGDEGLSRGASTIPMQVARNLFLWQSPFTYLRKALEIPLALIIDLVWPKRRILTIYFNIAEWGDGIFGAEAASQTYFGKHARDLSLEEAALLAGVLPNPQDRDPRQPDRALLIHERVVLKHLASGGPNLSCLR
ncbi:MAG TPA: transglycosylase domain-containing protein [Methylovirgula sp.]